MATTQETAASPKKAGAMQLLTKIHGHPPLLNIGKVKKKKSKKLKKGKVLPGGVLNHLQSADESLTGDNQHVIISYEAKPSKKRKKKKKLKFMGLKINRKTLKNRMKKNGIRASFL